MHHTAVVPCVADTQHQDGVREVLHDWGGATEKSAPHLHVVLGEHDVAVWIWLIYCGHGCALRCTGGSGA